MRVLLNEVLLLATALLVSTLVTSLGIYFLWNMFAMVFTKTYIISFYKLYQISLGITIVVTLVKLGYNKYFKNNKEKQND